MDSLHDNDSLVGYFQVACLDHSSWYAWRNASSDNGAGSHIRSLTNGHAWQNYRTAAYPDFVFYGDGARMGAAPTVRSRWTVIDGFETYPGANLYMFSNNDFRFGAAKTGFRVQERPGPNRDVAQPFKWYGGYRPPHNHFSRNPKSSNTEQSDPA